MTGVLVAVVGPSGAGKDTLLNAARAALAGDPGFRFLRRVITRPAEAGGEDHLAASRPAFRATAASGGFAVWWDAHGLLYGIPRDALETALDAGAAAVANLSRHALPDAASRYPLRVVNVTAPLHARAARLAARGRETTAEVAARLSRDAALPPGLTVEGVANDATVEEGVARMLRALRAVAGTAA